uniref:NAD-dependent epimerase/dehydratase family protein n=1 Tax=Flavobacterium sp. TaxID=239 RepID=UPI00404AA1F7
MENILITGGAGFIGSKLAQRLVEMKYQVFIIDDLSKGVESNIPKETIFIKGKCEKESTYKLISKIDFKCIYHFAGQSSGEKSFSDPLNDLNANAASTLTLLKFAISIHCKKFIFTSTMSVYGDNITPFNESMLPNPLSFYGVGKLASEHYLRLYSKFGIDTTSVRLFNVYGPGQDLKDFKQGMVSIFLGQALKGENIIVKGSKNRFRDFIYIDDVVHNLIQIGLFVKEAPLIINFCSGRKTSIDQLLKLISKYWPKKLNIMFAEGTPGDQFGSLGCPKIMNKYNISFDTEIEYGIKTTIDYILNE